MTVKQLSDGNDDGQCLGQNAADPVAFHGAAPIAQMTVTTAPVATASATSSYGYTQSQADAIITWIRAVDAHLKLKGVIASS